MNDLVRAAVDYARRGWPVFPVHGAADGECTCGDPTCTSPGKHPRTHRGFKNATTNVKQIELWWKQHPDSNIGVPTGPKTFFALDVDPQHGGEFSLDDLVARHGPLPDTVQSLTGGGGVHHLFRCPPGTPCSVSKVAPGIDVRGVGGYIVVSPSMHESGRRYEWEASSGPDDVEFADPPKWLVGNGGNLAGVILRPPPQPTLVCARSGMRPTPCRRGRKRPRTSATLPMIGRTLP